MTVDLSCDNRNFADHAGGRHPIFLIGVPGEELGDQGDLSDLARRQELTDLWGLLRWSPEAGTGFSFEAVLERAYLTMDLDCFVVDWRNYLFPWPEEVYRDKFMTASTYCSTRGWTGKRCFHGLLKQAGTVDIAREPSCCGGRGKVSHRSRGCESIPLRWATELRVRHGLSGLTAGGASQRMSFATLADGFDRAWPDA